MILVIESNPINSHSHKRKNMIATSILSNVTTASVMHENDTSKLEHSDYVEETD